MLKNLILAALFVMIALPTQAGECPKMKAHKEKMQAFLTGDLELDAKAAEKVGAALKDFHVKRMTAAQEKKEAFQALAKLVNDKETKLEAYEAAVKRLHDARKSVSEAQKARCSAMGDLLNAKQIAILLVHMEKAHGHHDFHGKKASCGACDCGCDKGDKPCDCKGDCKGDCGCNN